VTDSWDVELRSITGARRSPPSPYAIDVVLPELEEAPTDVNFFDSTREKYL
jgi:hypothetical protein